MEDRLTRLIRIALVAGLILTAVKGAMKTPEVAGVFLADDYFLDLENDAEMSLIMKERHFDYNQETLKALELLRARINTAAPTDGLISAQTLPLAIGKALAKDVRNADDLLLANENLERIRLMRQQGWRMGCGCPSLILPKAGPQ